MKEYHHYLDLAKGIGIFLVIAGHGLFPFHYAIDVFHMPLFFFISGITFGIPENMPGFVLKKINRIAVPWIFFSLAGSIVMQFLPPVGGGPFNGPLWFLQTLFVAVILYAVLLRNLSRRGVHVAVLAFSVAAYALSFHPELDVYPFSLTRAFAATVFVHLGCCFAVYVKRSRLLQRPKRTAAHALAGFACYAVGLWALVHFYDADGSFVSAKAYRNNYFLFYLTSAGGGNCHNLCLYAHREGACPQLARPEFLGHHVCALPPDGAA